MTFIDVANILSLVRDIAEKILSVLSLFFAFISLFALLAIISLFSRFQKIEDIKRRLYPFFGAKSSDILTSFRMSRLTVFMTTFVLASLAGTVLFLVILRTSVVLEFDPLSLLLVLILTG